MRRLLALWIALLVSTWTLAAAAQTWVGPRTTPSINEIVAIDATGEEGWLYGWEDLAGDGQEFRQQEQSIDIRTVYASTDAQRFWVRLYVSDENQAGGNVTAYVFIDADHDTATGGTAQAEEIHPLFTTGASFEGFDYVIEISGNGSIAAIWEWSEQPTGEYQSSTPAAAEAEAEADQDVDPIEINLTDHGYLQGMVDLDLVGLTEACNAMLFVRSVHGSGDDDSDLEVGTIGPCVPVDANGDDVPDLVLPTDPCDSDDQCPGGGICVDGVCIVPAHCLTNDDCDAGEECIDHVCVPVGGEDCTDDADCLSGYCVDGTCQPCTSDDQCGPGRRCLAGRCVADPNAGVGGAGGGTVVAGVPIYPGDEVQGGALTCAAATGSRAGGSLAGLLLAILGLAAWRRRAG